jgi:membrane fusion protein, multidrug efflux system
MNNTQNRQRFAARRPTGRRMFPIFILAASALAAGISGCSPRQAPRPAMAAPVIVAQAFTTNVPVQIEPPPIGHVAPYSVVTIRPQVGGILQHVHFTEGAEVKSNDLLFTIDPRPTQAALEAAKAALARDRAQLENARIQYDREQKLFDQKLVAQDDYDTSKAGLDALTGTVAADNAAVSNATLNLDFTQIRAPFDGVTGGLQFYAGNVVQAQADKLVTINQIQPIYVQFGVPEQYLPEIRRELRAHPLKVSARFENMKGAPAQGELTFVDNAVDATTGMIQLKAKFPNEAGELWPGQFVTVSLTLTELWNIVVVPSPAVQTGQSGQFIYVVKPDKTAEQRPVTIGITYDGLTVVQQGIQAGETVVTDGQLRLAPGAAVNIKNSEAGSTNRPARGQR